MQRLAKSNVSILIEHIFKLKDFWIFKKFIG